jgi:ABC-type branched-subunit amino acid transport system substrate-binding protein
MGFVIVAGRFARSQETAIGYARAEARMGRLASLFLLLSVALAIASGCRGASLPASATDPIRIGVVLPQTGGLAEDGQAWVRAVRLAVGEVNAAGGLLGGHRVELDVVDSGGTAAIAVAATHDVLADGAVAIIGDGGSDGSLAIYQMVTQREGVVQISGSATSSSLTMANAMLTSDRRYFFRTAPPDGYQAQVVDHIATMNAHCTNLAVLYQNDAYGMPLGQSIATAFDAHGTVTGSVPFTPSQGSYATETAMIAAGTPDCVALIAYPQDAGVILRNWRDGGHPTVQWIGTDGLFSADFLTEAGSAALVQDFWGASPLTTPDTPEFNDFAARYRATYGHAPENFTASYYDATALVLLSIERAGDVDGAMVRDAMREIGGSGGTQIERAGELREALAALHATPMRALNYQGASGPIDFDANGDTVAPYEIWQISGTPATFHSIAVVQATDLTP